MVNHTNCFHHSQLNFSCQGKSKFVAADAEKSISRSHVFHFSFFFLLMQLTGVICNDTLDPDHPLPTSTAPICGPAFFSIPHQIIGKTETCKIKENKIFSRSVILFSCYLRQIFFKINLWEILLFNRSKFQLGE